MLDVNGDGRLDARDEYFTFGEPGDVPVVAKWDGGRTDRVGVFRDGQWLTDVSGSHNMANAMVMQKGSAGEHPFVADFKGAGKPELGTTTTVAGPAVDVATGPAASSVE